MKNIWGMTPSLLLPQAGMRRHFMKKYEIARENAKKQKQQMMAHEQLEGQSVQQIKNALRFGLKNCVNALEDALKRVKTGQVSHHIFNHLDVKVHSVPHPLTELCSVKAKENNVVVVKVLDPALINEVLTSLKGSQYCFSHSIEGNEIIVNLGHSLEEKQDAAKRQLRVI